MVGAEGLGDEASQAKWAPKGHSRRRAQARGHSAPYVDRPNRVQLVEEGGCRVTSNNETKGYDCRAAHLRETDRVAGHGGLELRNVDANYRFERSHRFA